MEQHPDATIITSFPRLKHLTNARVLAEIGDDRSRFADARGLKAFGGSAPITRASGRKTVDALSRHGRLMDSHVEEHEGAAEFGLLRLRGSDRPATGQPVDPNLAGQWAVPPSESLALPSGAASGPGGTGLNGVDSRTGRLVVLIVVFV